LQAGSLGITPLKLAQGEIRCIGFQEIQLAGGFGRNINRENIGDGLSAEDDLNIVLEQT